MARDPREYGGGWTSEQLDHKAQQDAKKGTFDAPPTWTDFHAHPGDPLYDDYKRSFDHHREYAEEKESGGSNK